MDARHLVQNVSDLVSLPAVNERVMALLDAEATQVEIGDVLRHDPSLTARLLKAANARRYGASSQVTDVGEAIDLMGTAEVRSLVTATAAVDSFRNVPVDLVDMNNFWQHSVCCALTARALAAQCGAEDQESLFLAGLLHDVGQLIIYHELPELARQVLEKAGEPEERRYRAEQAIIGFTHAQVGAELLRVWGFPTRLHEAVEFHHEPVKARRFPVDAAIVHLATCISNAFEPSWKNPSLKQGHGGAWPEAWTITGLSESIIEPTLDTVAWELLDVADIVAPGASCII